MEPAKSCRALTHPELARPMQGRGGISVRALDRLARAGPPVPQSIGSIRPRISASQCDDPATFFICGCTLLVSADGCRLLDRDAISIATRTRRRRLLDRQSFRP